MLTRIGRMSKMSYLNIQNRSHCSFGCAILKYGESNTMESALNTWQMPQTARYPYITLMKVALHQSPLSSVSCKSR